MHMLLRDLFQDRVSNAVSPGASGFFDLELLVSGEFVLTQVCVGLAAVGGALRSSRGLPFPSLTQLRKARARPVLGPCPFLLTDYLCGVFAAAEALHPGRGSCRVHEEVHPPHRQQGDAHCEVPDGHLCGEAHRDSGVAGGELQVPEVHR